MKLVKVNSGQKFARFPSKILIFFSFIQKGNVNNPYTKGLDYEFMTYVYL